MKCPVCLLAIDEPSFMKLASHILSESSSHDHSAWLDRYVGKGMNAGQVESRLRKLYEIDGGLGSWIISRLIERIYGDPPHPFILRLQHPDDAIIRGYVLEHHHFLVQWVKSCASVLCRTDDEVVTLYEIDNIVSEFRGIPPDIPSHHELLLRMGESVGLTRSEVYSASPLPATARCIQWWQKIADECSWVETMAAMHTLELTANPQIREMGSRLTYFDPAILKDTGYRDAVKDFLHEGYMADVDHSMEALELIEKHSGGRTQDIQSVVFKTVKLLDDYLNARLERGRVYGSKQ